MLLKFKYSNPHQIMIADGKAFLYTSLAEHRI